MAYIVIACIVMACIVMVYTAMAYIVMADAAPALHLPERRSVEGWRFWGRPAGRPNTRPGHVGRTDVTARPGHVSARPGYGNTRPGQVSASHIAARPGHPSTRPGHVGPTHDPACPGHVSTCPGHNADAVAGGPARDGHGRAGRGAACERRLGLVTCRRRCDTAARRRAGRQSSLG